MYRSVRRLAGRALDARIWRPSHAELIWRHLVYRNRNREAGFTDHDHLLGAARWLERAQDVTGDGGVAGRYLLGEGWTSSYPETTGYIIPTLITLAAELGSGRFLDRAQQAVDFLLPLQFATWAFPGGEVRENVTQPSMFNTAQILGGLLAWHSISRDDRVLEAASRAGNWLVSIQSPDGAWRKYTYNQVTVTYSSHASCWLAGLGRHTGTSSYLDGAAKHFDWVACWQPITFWIGSPPMASCPTVLNGCSRSGTFLAALMTNFSIPYLNGTIRPMARSTRRHASHSPDISARSAPRVRQPRGERVV